MGYIENMETKRFNEFFDQLKALSEEGDVRMTAIYENAFLVSSLCGFRSGFEILKSVRKSLKEIKKHKNHILKEYKKFEKRVKNDTTIDDNKKNEIIKEVKEQVNENIKKAKKNISQLEKCRNDLIVRLFNWCAYLFAFLILFVISPTISSQFIWYRILGYVIMGLSVGGFILQQVVYAKKYLKAIKLNKQGKAIYIINKSFSVLLVVWWCIFIVSIANKWNTDICGYILAFLLGIRATTIVYDLFWDSSIFDENGGSTIFAAAVLIGLGIAAATVNNEIFAKISGGITLTACLLLSMLIIKRFIIDKVGVDNMSKLMGLMATLLFTIVETILSLYLLFWVKSTEGQVVDNTLFSSIVGVYAALIGGGLTLAGVAWTIKNNSAERNEDLRIKVCPYISVVSMTGVSMRNLVELLRVDIEFEENSLLEECRTHVDRFRVRLSKNADCIIKGILVNGQFKNVKNEVLSVAESEFNVDGVRLRELTTIDTFSIVATDILQNWYEYSCKIVQIDAEQKDNRVYSVQSIGLPVLMSKNAVKQLNDSLNTKNNTNRG